MEFKTDSLSTLKDKGLTGLRNLGNTCFMNSVLQCVSNTEYFTLYILSNRFYEDRNIKKREIRLLREYSKLINAMWESNCVVDPTTFKHEFGQFKDCYLGYNQQDANELFMRLMELLHNACSFQASIEPVGKANTEIDKLQIESIKEFAFHFKKSYSYVVDCFAGQFFGITVCSKCRYTSKKFDPFFNITLEIPTGEGMGSVDLHSCFKHHCKMEILKGDDKWYCEGECKSKQNAYRRITIWKTPVCLVLCLKRFAFTMGARKINTLVDFPLDGLDLFEYVKAGNDATKSVYDLYGVVNHTGDAMGGHYFSYCKNRNGKWYNFNDTGVSEIDKSTIVTPMAYMLFYEKRNVLPKMLLS